MATSPNIEVAALLPHARSEQLDEVLQSIMSKIVLFFGPERWSLMMVDEATSELYYAIAVGENPQSLQSLRVPLGEGMVGWVAATGNSLVVPDLSRDARWAAFALDHPELNIRSVACFPIRANNRTFGVIQLINSKEDLTSEFSVSFLRMLCDYAAIAIQNAGSMNPIQVLTIADKPVLSSAEQLTNYMRLVERVVGAFGDEAKASRWLSLPNVDLDGATPLQSAKKDGYMGRSVEPVLIRIEHGIYI